jgi:hypothetical protein
VRVDSGCADDIDPLRTQRCTARIDSADRTASCSDVAQFDTEMRMAAMPCHVVPLSQQVPSA